MRLLLAAAFSVMLLYTVAAGAAFAHGDGHQKPSSQTEVMEMPDHVDGMGANSAPAMIGNKHGMMMGGAQGTTPKTFSGRVISWLGVWHPAAIHFPIALVLTVAFLEGMAAVRKRPIYSSGTRVLLAFAALGSIAAALLGWANAGLPDVRDGTSMTLHRWLGSALPFAIAALWYLKPSLEDSAVRPSSRPFAVLLGGTVILILAQAYLGGEITHGANHMAF